MAATAEVAAGRRAPARLFVGGAWRDAADGHVFTTEHPATAEPIDEVARAGPVDVDAAVTAARAALTSREWSHMEALDRGALLWRIADALAADKERLAHLEVLDTGKPLKEARIDLDETIATFRYFAGWPARIHGETLPVRGSVFNYTLREPVGVVGAIVPWNFPLLQAAWKLAPALACGNTVVLKPAEQSPLTALELAHIASEAGVPPGVLNVLPGDGETTGAAIVRHPGVDAIAFTGSTAVGRLVMRDAAARTAPVSLELGGKSPNIVFQDADLRAAARGAYNAIFYNAGQCCTAGSRLLVQESVHDALLELLLERARALVPGDPFDPRTRLGPLVSAAQQSRVLEYAERAIADGGRPLLGGGVPRVEGFPNGYWVEPTLIDGVHPDATIAQEEVFGPVLAILTFRDEAEAIELANRTIYGLAAGIWTRDGMRAHRVARAIRAGTVWINMYNPLDPASPFGGMKQSGFGRELGADTIGFYTQVKSVWYALS
jgi:acyl-CoA reductase-like NAD-dependent aldehyde dehydrogenase